MNHSFDFRRLIVRQQHSPLPQAPACLAMRVLEPDSALDLELEPGLGLEPEQVLEPALD